LQSFIKKVLDVLKPVLVMPIISVLLSRKALRRKIKLFY